MDTTNPDTMRAIVHTAYGPPDVLELRRIAKPVVTDDGVLVRIHAASVNAGDWHLMRGSPFFIRFMLGGLFKPGRLVPGCAMAGRVEAVGRKVTRFRPGDEVFGDLSESGFGAFAEYVCAPEHALAHKPANVGFEAAAAVPVAALAALQGLRDCGRIQAGHKVLVLGASGGFGSFAVQIAKSCGAEVTGVCGTDRIDLLRALGADHVIDRTRQDVTRDGRHYDLILDAAAFRPLRDYLRILTPGGRYVMVGGSTPRFMLALLFGGLISRFARRSVKCLASRPNPADMDTLKEMLESGRIVPVIDRRYELAETPAAIRRLEQRQVRGKVVITMARQ